jgi:hypothetical protein
MAVLEATVGLTVIDGSGPEPVMHTRCWWVPPELIGELADRLTALYGEPDEMIADPRVMAKAGQRTAEEDGTVYLTAEVPGG